MEHDTTALARRPNRQLSKVLRLAITPRHLGLRHVASSALGILVVRIGQGAVGRSGLHESCSLRAAQRRLQLTTTSIPSWVSRELLFLSRMSSSPSLVASSSCLAGCII